MHLCGWLQIYWKCSHISRCSHPNNNYHSWTGVNNTHEHQNGQIEIRNSCCYVLWQLYGSIRVFSFRMLWTFKEWFGMRLHDCIRDNDLVEGTNKNDVNRVTNETTINWCDGRHMRQMNVIATIYIEYVFWTRTITDLNDWKQSKGADDSNINRFECTSKSIGITTTCLCVIFVFVNQQHVTRKRTTTRIMYSIFNWFQLQNVISLDLISLSADSHSCSGKCHLFI